MQKITGYSLDELKKIKLEDTYENKESRKRLLEALGRHGSVSDYPLRLKRKGGSVYDALLSISQVTYDGQHLIQTLCQDVTERNRAEELIKKTSEEWGRTFDAITELVFVADRNYRIVRANKKLCEALKKKPEELLGKRCYEVVHGTEEPWPDCPYKRTLETKEATSAEINDPNLGMLLLVTNSPIFDERGELVQCVHVAKDISERREALERLRVVNEKLGVVGGLTRHDIRNKLSAVAANSYLAKKTLHNDHKAWAYLREIETACRQTTKILDFAAAYEKLGTEELFFVDVDKAFEEAVSLIQGSQGVEVIRECHGLTVLADSLLRQLFYNLIDNSLKHGQKVRRIRVHSEEEKNRIELFYEDDGVGIPHAIKSKIFAGSSREDRGSGYGLYLVRRMMDVYGSWVYATICSM